MDFLPQFTAVRFDFDQRAGLFRQAGAQFVVLVAGGTGTAGRCKMARSELFLLEGRRGAGGRRAPGAGERMTKLTDKIQYAVEEGRILYLGVNILIGFQFRSSLERGFDQLPTSLKYLKTGSLTLQLLVLALLMSITAYHRIVERGNDSERLHRYITGVMDVALLPFACSLGLDLFVVSARIAGNAGAMLFGALGTLTALFFWYGLEYLRRPVRIGEETGIALAAAARQPHREERPMDGRGGAGTPGSQPAQPTPIKNKIEHLLEENRVVLPGAQALLGFQLASVFVDGFEKLPQSAKYVHLAGLAMVGLSVVLLMAPAAYHRIVEQGEESEDFHRVASVFVVAAMAPLALGIAADFYIVIRKVTESNALGVAAALVALGVFFGLWFGYTTYRRTLVRPPSPLVVATPASPPAGERASA